MSFSGTTTGVLATVALTTAALAILKHTLWPRHPQIIPSPLHTVLPSLSEASLSALDYRPDAFPGARDVSTPYGSIRVYEWGPETGPKVLFIHGISTTCMTLGKLAHALVNEKGCRVMLFDLFGRGFSDGVGDLPHDARLYTTQCLLALSSSPLPWTGTSALRVIGYSLGGGIAVHLAATIPQTISSLVLLAPSGLIEPHSFGALSNFLFRTGIVPERLLAFLTKRRLQRPIAASSTARRHRTTTTTTTTTTQPSSPSPSSSSPNNPIDASLAEIPNPNPTTTTTSSPDKPPQDQDPDPDLSKKVYAQVRWSLQNNAAFIPTFMSTIRHGPLVNQHSAFSKLAARPPKSTVVLLAEDDEIIDPVHYAAAALPLLGGAGHVVWSIVPGAGHDFPMSCPGEVLGVVYGAWGWD
ncbi:Alpha/Beta hydrolase protein [Echria macrotheca]|uniref:Alpha/Beta hydrolase protein n=1 Tax=Echria macrotheca TaxID=438768 RepID=A0AAJ0BBD6_9PEZI|nr:Alpha/Beta hydrolase protein [Echria macrotheca]